MVEIARRRAPDVRFHIGRFEDVELPSRAFEAVFSATAFHWVAPTVGWSKVARVLRPGGLLALLWHVGGSMELDARRGNVSELWSWLGKREIARPEAADLFADVRLSKVPVETVETVEAMLGVVRTTSAYQRLDGERQGVFARRLAGVVEAEGGTHRSTHFATLVTARAAA